MKPTPATHGHTSDPQRETPRKALLVGTTSGFDPPSHNISLPSVLHHLIGKFFRHQGFSTKQLRRPSMAKYFLQLKHLLTTPPMILVPEKLEMGPSETRPYLARKDTNPNNQPLAEHRENRLIQNQRRPEPSYPSPSHGQVLTLPIFESAERKFVYERSIA